MKHPIRYAAVLIVGSVLLLAMGVLHPRSVPFEDSQALARMAAIDAVAHSLAILGTWLVLTGMVGLSRMLGLERISVIAALLAFAMASCGVVVAAAIDGFVIPQVAEQWTAADVIAQANPKQLVRFAVLVASSLTRIYLLLSAVAISLWSWTIYKDRLSQGLPLAGVVVSAAAIAVLISGPPSMSAHEVLALMLCQIVWMAFAAALMIYMDSEPSNRDN